MTWRRQQGRSLQVSPSLRTIVFPLVAQWQSNRLISDRRMFDSSREDQSPRRWIRSVKPEWRWSGFLTRAHVVQNHPDPPVMDLCPQRRRERILNPLRKHRRFESDQVLQFHWPMYPSGEGTGLSIREGEFDPRHGRQVSGCSLARRKRTPRTRETAGSNPAILTNRSRVHTALSVIPGRERSERARNPTGCKRCSEMDSGFSPAGCPGMTEDSP